MMFRKSKKKSARRFYRKTKRKKSSKFLEISLVFVAILVLVYGFSFFKKISQSQVTLGSDLHKDFVYIRTQILNGCQEKGVAQRLADRMRGFKVDNIVYDVIEVGNFERSNAEQSFILDRSANEGEAKPSQMAHLTAEALGIENENVLCKKLENNYQDIELTIVIGKDYERLFKLKR